MTLLRRISYILSAIILTVAMSLDAEAASQKRKTTQRRRQTTTTTRSADKIKKEQSTTQRKISETSKRITTTDKELKRQLNSLNSLNADIRQQDATVHRLRTHIDSLGTAITSTSDSIAILESNLNDLRTAYAKALRSLQPSAGEMDAIAFVFSAGSFSEAYSRVRYLNRFSEWRRRKAADIDQAIDRISQRRQHLTGLRHQQDKACRQAEEARRSLSLKQNESEKLVTNLRRQGTQLKAELARQKKQAQALDRELDRIIAAEQQRIAREEAARKAKEAKNTKTTTRTIIIRLPPLHRRHSIIPRRDPLSSHHLSHTALRLLLGQQRTAPLPSKRTLQNRTSVRPPAPSHTATRRHRQLRHRHRSPHRHLRPRRL